MRLLLDEDVPAPLTELLKHLLRGHQVDHVYGIGWGGKKDLNLFPDAAKAGYDALLTNNLRQFNDPDECKAIQRSGLHHIGYDLADGTRRLGSRHGCHLRCDPPCDLCPRGCEGSADRPHPWAQRQRQAVHDHEPGDRSPEPLLALRLGLLAQQGVRRSRIRSNRTPVRRRPR